MSVERELLLANAFLEAVLENIPDMIFVKDAERLRFVRFNRAGEELLGYPRSELIGKSDFDFFPREEAEFFTRTDREVLASGRTLDIAEEPIDTRARGKRYLHTKKVGIYGPDGKAEFLLGISEDVTELRRRTLDLNAAVEELESFSYSVSHDLRAPLRAIDGYAAIVLSDHAAALGPEAADLLGRVRDAVARMNALIEALLSLARIGRVPIRIEEVDLSALARETFEDLVRAFPERRVRFTAAPGVMARGDPSLLGSVLENLIGNAMKFTRDAADPAIEFGSEAAGGETVYFVKDNGCGFDMSGAGQLFQPFRRLRDSGAYPGSGIGLATVRRIVVRHGGRVWAHGEPGRGAVVRFTLAPPAPAG